MTDDLEPRLRDSLGSTALPGAPATLRDYLARLPTAGGTPRARGLRAPQVVAVGVALLVVAAGAGLLATGSLKPAATAIASATDRAVASDPASPETAPPTMFVAPGITFEIPPGWSDQTSAVEPSTNPGSRFVGLLVSGMTLCPVVIDPSAPPTPKPTSCFEEADQPGSAMLTIMEYPHLFPWAHRNPFAESEADPAPVADSPYPAWGPTSAAYRPSWNVGAPDGGLYHLTLIAPERELDTRIPEVVSIIKSLHLSEWEPAPEVVDGRIHVESRRGFSFDYPAGWTRYYPQGASMFDAPVVTVASNPLEPPCSSDSCGSFSLPPGTVAIGFRAGRMPTRPDWSIAPTTIGGQPAFGPTIWDAVDLRGSSAEEGYTWNVRLPDIDHLPGEPVLDFTLGINASLRGPDLPALRAAIEEVLVSLRIGR